MYFHQPMDSHATTLCSRRCEDGGWLAGQGACLPVAAGGVKECLQVRWSNKTCGLAGLEDSIGELHQGEAGSMLACLPTREPDCQWVPVAAKKASGSDRAMEKQLSETGGLNWGAGGNSRTCRHLCGADGRLRFAGLATCWPCVLRAQKVH